MRVKTSMQTPKNRRRKMKKIKPMSNCKANKNRNPRKNLLKRQAWMAYMIN